MKKLLSALWRMPRWALYGLYCLAAIFATFKYRDLIMGSTLRSALTAIGIPDNATVVADIATSVFYALLQFALNYLLIRIAYRIFAAIYLRTYTRGGTALISVKAPFSYGQFVGLMFILLLLLNVLVGLVRLLYLAGVSYYFLIESVLVPLCILVTTLFGYHIFRRYILTESVAYNAILALAIPIGAAILLF